MFHDEQREQMSARLVELLKVTLIDTVHSLSRLASLRQRQETALRRREFQVLVQAFHEIIVIRKRSSDVR